MARCSGSYSGRWKQRFLTGREKKILDAGCGTGAILKQLGDSDRNIGVDLAAEAISLGHERGLNNVQQADICALPFADASFDAVICSNEIRRLLLENGFAIRRLTYWTTFLFPIAVAARTLVGSKPGRDFEAGEASFVHRIFAQVMALELGLLKQDFYAFRCGLVRSGQKISPLLKK